MENSDTHFLIICRTLIEEKLNWLNTTELKQRDFQYLSDEIFEKTKTQLSLSTVKRIWSKNYSKSFQISTLDALAVYLDYQNWHHFKAENYESPSTPNKTKRPKLKIQKPKKNHFIRFGFIGLILLLLGFFLSISYFNEKTVEYVQAPDDLLFTSKKSVKNGVPNTVIFNYDLKDQESDSLFIQLSWNPKERIQIDKENSFYTSTYFYPGYHFARLLIDNKFIKGHFVHITTDGWMALVRAVQSDISPEYIKSEQLISNDIIYASPEVFEQNNIRRDQDEFYLSYFNVRTFEDLTADHFSLETNIKIFPIKNSVLCPTCWIFVFAENGVFSIPIASQGCVSDITMGIANKRISGKTNDLSALGCDLSKWRNVKISAKDQQFELYLDHQLIYETSLDKEMGTIKGLQYLFRGYGAIDDVFLRNQDDQIMYEEDFSN